MVAKRKFKYSAKNSWGYRKQSKHRRNAKSHPPKFAKKPGNSWLYGNLGKSFFSSHHMKVTCGQGIHLWLWCDEKKKKKSWKRPEPDRMGGAGLESFFSFRKPFFLQTPFSFSRAPFFLQTPFSPRHPFFLQTPFFPPIWNFPAWIFSFVKLVISNLEISNLKISSLGLRVYITLGFFQNINITLRFFF